MTNIEELQKILTDHEERIKVLELGNHAPLTNPPGSKKMSLKEFLISKKPKGDVEKTLLIAYYFEKYEHKEKFNKKDIVEGFKMAREQTPKNTTDKIQKNIKKGLIMDMGEKDGFKAWTLTNSGNQLIDQDDD